MKSEKLDKAFAVDLVNMLETLSGLFTRTAEPLEDSEQGRDILNFIENEGEHWGRMLGLYGKVFPIRQFQERVAVFEHLPNTKKNKPGWECSRIEPAATQLMTSDPEHLRQLMRSLLQLNPNKSVAIWLHAAPMIADSEMFLVYVQHQDGMEAMYSIMQGHWMCLDMTAEVIDRVLSITRKISSEHRKKREGLWSMQEKALGVEAYSDVAAALREIKAPELSKEQWAAVINRLVQSDLYRALMAEGGRVLSTPALREAHTLLDTSMQLVEQAFKHAEDRVTQAGKDHERVKKRFLKDLEMYKLAKTGATTRATQLTRELAEVRKQLRAATASGEKNINTGSVALALDAFFPVAR